MRTPKLSDLEPSQLQLVVLMSTASPWSREVVRHLSALGVSVHVVELQPKDKPRGYIEYGNASHTTEVDDLRQQAASVHRVPTPRWLPRRLASSASAVRRIARECQADIVLTLYGGSLAAAAYLSGVRPYVVYVVGSDVLLATSLQRIIARLSLSSSASVLANGAHLARSASQLAPRANVAPHYLGVDLAEHSPAKDRPKHSFVCTRGFLPVYDNATIVRAFGEVIDVPADLTLSFLSAGPLLEDTRRLADQVIPTAWRDRVEFFGGVSYAELKARVSSGSFYLSASLSDGTSASLLEAMACGLIPIVSDIPANREWVVPEVNGLLFRPGDHRALASCIRRAIDGELWIPEAGRANRRLVEDRADANKSMTGLRNILTAHAFGEMIAPQARGQ